MHFVNEGMLGSIADFRRKFENPILKSRDSFASDKEKERGELMLKELLALVNRFLFFDRLRFLFYMYIWIGLAIFFYVFYFVICLINV